MSRASLASIISRVRLLIDDPAGAGAVFTDDEIQDALDRRRDEARYLPLDEIGTIAPGGATTYLTFSAPVGNWEDAVLVDAGYAVLTPATSDAAAGRWTTSTQPSLPVMLTGFTHDLYGAAADLLEVRAAKESDSFDVSADGLTLSRSQKATAYAARARDYRARARAGVSTLVRTDEAR